MDKLYEVKVEVTYYAKAETAAEAMLHADEAVNDAFIRDCATAVEVTTCDHPLAGEWDENCLIYHDGSGDLTLGKLLNRLPHRE